MLLGKMIGAVTGNHSAQQHIGDLFALFVLGVGAALGTTLGDLGLLLGGGGVSVRGVELSVAGFGLFGHAAEGGALCLGQLVPVAASDAGDIAVVSLDVLEVVLVPEPGTEDHEGIGWTGYVALLAVAGVGGAGCEGEVGEEGGRGDGGGGGADGR